MYKKVKTFKYPGCLAKIDNNEEWNRKPHKNSSTYIPLRFRIFQCLFCRREWPCFVLSSRLREIP